MLLNFYMHFQKRHLRAVHLRAIKSVLLSADCGAEGDDESILK